MSYYALLTINRYLPATRSIPVTYPGQILSKERQRNGMPQPKSTILPSRPSKNARITEIILTTVDLEQ